MTRHDDAMRTIVDLPEEQIGALARLCEAQKISRAEAVRRAVALMLKETASEQKDVGFGLWKHKRISSRKLVDNLRGEWGS
jgi:metal-responsive CopG/Arc/MetJ family transcriptional regulator